MTDTEDREFEELRSRLEEAEETLRAIRAGEVDGLVVDGPHGEQVYTLQGADHSYRVLIEAMQQGAASLARDGTITFCNRCFADLLERPHEKVVGADVAYFLPASHRPAFETLLRLGVSHNSQAELLFETQSGALIPVLVNISPMPAVHHSLCLVVTDLTETKKHQSLQEANRRKDEFLAMLAHELRNPLAPIQNAVAILQHLNFADDKLAYSRDIIGRQVEHLSRLVDDLLDVSRITLGKVALKKEVVELAALLTRVVETARPTIDARRHQLTFSLPPRGVRVQADPTRLAQVVGNLLTNAVKYSEEGSRITLSAERRGTEVVIRVRDTGMGIAAELLPHIFDLFIQGDRSLARSEGGLGIGLTLVRRLVEMHGGAVEAISDGPGQGSEFIVRLPALPEETPSRNRTDNRHGELSNAVSRTVLIVEDNRDGADSLAMVLKLMGHRVRIAYNGNEAIEAAKDLQPQVVLLDIGLPGMSGYEVAARLRLLPEFQATTLIALTGYGQEEDKAKSREAGFDDHLVKPVNPATLKRLLECSA